MKDSYYFSHDSDARHDVKVIAMRAKYGYEGYGWYWAIIEMMRSSSGYKINIQDKFSLGSIAIDLSTTSEKIEKFIFDCVNEFKLFKSNKKYLTSNSLQKRMNKVEETREIRKRAAEEKWKKHRENKGNNANADKSDANADKSDANASDFDAKKRKERKVKERKVNGREKTIPPEFEWIIERCGAMNYPDFQTESENFFNYYNSNGWRVGKNPMKNWQAALANWFKNYKTFNNGKSNNTGNGIHTKRDYAGKITDVD